MELIDSHWFQAVAVIAVAALLLKRALHGPQKQFARLAILSILAGMAALSGAAQQSDLASWIGALLMLGGLLAALVMVLVDMQWTVRTGLASRKNNP